MNAVVEHMGWSAGTVRQRGGFYEADAELFPSVDVVVGYRLLFGVYSGIVPDGIDLVVTDIDWAGDATVLLSYVKGRTAGESTSAAAGGALDGSRSSSSPIVLARRRTPPRRKRCDSVRPVSILSVACPKNPPT
jgi:hypothetical protein